jgi:hypothetical protein
MPMSSFGEQQAVDGGRVEESAFKIVQLHPGVLVGVAGDAYRAYEFLRLLWRDLQVPGRSAKRVVDETLPIFADGERRFDAILIDSASSRTPYVIACSSDGAREDFPAGTPDPLIIGSLPLETRATVAGAIDQLRASSHPREAILVATLGLLQSLGVTEYLAANGVGGAFFGVRCSQQGVFWQPDIVYLLYNPGAITAAPIVADTAPELFTYSAEITIVRVLVREEAGIVISQLSEPATRLFIPPTADRRTEDEWRKVMLDQIVEPWRPLVASRYYVFLNRGYSAAYVYVNPTGGSGGRCFSFQNVGTRSHLQLDPLFVQKIESKVSPGQRLVVIMTEDTPGEPVHVQSWLSHEPVLPVAQGKPTE